jgi:phosphoglycolate phosphatase
MPHAIRCLLFDFDGTLADSFAAIAASTNHARATFGLSAMSETAVRDYVGHGLHQLMTDLVPTAPSADEAVRVYREHHETVAVPMTRLLPGVDETIADLHHRGFSLGVCSNKSVAFTKRLVSHLFPSGEFAVVLGPDDVGVPKPDPAMLIEGCRRLDAPIRKTIYVGDMVVDVRTAKAAGMRCWLVAGGAGGEQGWRDALALGPERVLDRFEEIRQLTALMSAAS